MFENEETRALAIKLNEFYVFTLQSIRHILNSTDVDKVTWCTASGENDPDSFASLLYSVGCKLFEKNNIVFGNFVLTGKQGFDILKKMGSPRFVFEGREGVLDSSMKVYYIPSMDDNRFVVSVYEPIDFKDDKDYRTYYNLDKTDNNIFQNMDAMVVGEIVDSESSNENNDVKSEMNDKCETESANSVNTTYGNIEFEQTTNPVISTFIQQSREQLDYKYIVQIIPDYTSSVIKDDWRDYKECLCYEGAEKCVKEIVDDPRQHKAKRVRIVVEHLDSSLENYIKEHTDSNGNLKPKLATISPEHIGKTITCAGCKDTIPYGKPFSYYNQSAYCSKKCCVGHMGKDDNNKLFEVSPDKSLEEYDREFTRYYSYE